MNAERYHQNNWKQKDPYKIGLLQRKNENKQNKKNICTAAITKYGNFHFA